MEALLQAPSRTTSSLAIFEAAAAITRKFGGDAASADTRLADFVESLAVHVLVIDVDLGAVARSAWLRCGRGSGHPAKLNMGDCFSYACARHHGLALLFKGDDFIHTDVVSAMPGHH